MLKETSQTTIKLSNYAKLYDILIAKDNFWRQLNEIVDFSFVYEELKDKYSSTMGRKAEDVVRMFKYLLLKGYFKLSDRGLIERTKTDMLFKYFLGYLPEETEFIDPSLLTVFRRERLSNKENEEETSTNLLDKLISKTVEIALKEGLIEVKNKIIQDSTHTNARFQHISPREELIRQARELRKSVYKIDETMHEKMPKKKETTGLLEDQIEYSKDQDARIGHKTADTSFFGYKTHIAMTPEIIITAATITSGEKHDGKELQKLVKKSQANGIEVEAVIGDGAYSEKDNIEFCEKNNIKLASKLSKFVTHGNSKRNNSFEYNKDAGMYVCKAGHMAINKTKNGSKKTKRGENSLAECYFFDIEKCKRCKYKEGCYKDGAKSKTYNVKIKDDIHIKHMDYMKTDEFQKLYSERYKIEAKNAELKSNFGYDEVNATGKVGITIQGATVLFLANMKRIIKLKEEKSIKNAE